MMDRGSQNPRLQCGECGRWMRLHGIDKDGRAIQRFYGSCDVTGGDHPCGKEVCTDCCPAKCEKLACDCQHPETTKDGFAAKSQTCPVHGDAGLRTTSPAPDRAGETEEMVLHPLSDIRDLDDVVHELGIQDSSTTPAEAVRELKDEIEKLRAALASPPAPDRAGVREIVRKIQGQAHAGAMLGGSNAYQACLEIEALVARLSAALTPGSGEGSGT